MLLKTKPVVTIIEKIFSPGGVDREPIMVLCPEPTLKQFFLRTSNSKAFLCTAASQDSPSFCVSTIVPRYTHTLFIQYFPEVPEFLHLHLAVTKQKKPLHLLPPLQHSSSSERTSQLCPSGRSGETPPGAILGWINCTYKSHSSALSSATRSLKNTDCRQIKNRTIPLKHLLIQLC